MGKVKNHELTSNAKLPHQQLSVLVLRAGQSAIGWRDGQINGVEVRYEKDMEV